MGVLTGGDQPGSRSALIHAKLVVSLDMTRATYGTKRDEGEGNLLPCSSRVEAGEETLRHRNNGGMFDLASFGLIRTANPQIIRDIEDMMPKGHRVFPNLINGEAEKSSNKKRHPSEGHLAIVVAVSLLLTLCTAILWYSFIWPWPLEGSNTVDTDVSDATYNQEIQSRIGNLIAIDSDGDGETGFSDEGMEEKDIDINSVLASHPVYESPKVADGDKILDLKGSIYSAPSNDHVNPMLDKLAVAILTTKGTYGKNIPTQMETFLKQLRYFLVIGDHSGMYGGSTAAAEAINRNNAGIARLQHQQGIRALQDLYEAFPDSEWFIVSKDDNYMFLDNIRAFLDDNKYDYNEPLYFGSHSKFQGCATFTQPLNKPSPVIGSLASGVILSHAAVKAIVSKKVVDKCFKKFKSCQHSDVVLGLCLADHNINMTPEPRLSAVALSKIAWPQNGCQEPFSFPHTSSYLMQRIYNSQYSTGLTSSGEKTKWDSHATYAALFSNIYHDIGVFMTDIDNDLPGGDYMHSKCESGSQCQTLCKAEDQCLAWVYDTKLKTCWLKDTLAPKKERQGVISGVLPSRYVCENNPIQKSKKKKQGGLQDPHIHGQTILGKQSRKR
ncbi:hypothetical protein BSLG_006306 [Batrachochytrium salamandrivorans]|nr:hypothetical protein BSLG_006306 [Batrachochytrium salamandrivorans]